MNRILTGHQIKTRLGQRFIPGEIEDFLGKEASSRIGAGNYKTRAGYRPSGAGKLIAILRYAKKTGSHPFLVLEMNII